MTVCDIQFAQWREQGADTLCGGAACAEVSMVFSACMCEHIFCVCLSSIMSGSEGSILSSDSLLHSGSREPSTG